MLVKKKGYNQKVYETSNMPIQEYVEYLDREGYICSVEFSYVINQKLFVGSNIE